MAMTAPITPVNARYGAPLGRPNRSHTGTATMVKVTLQCVRLNNGGYDAGGAYWGLGAPLYWAGADDGSFDLFFRARSRDAAKAIVRQSLPNATFYR